MPRGDLAEPPAFMVAPTTCARAAVRRFHEIGSAEARDYLTQSVVGRWLDHDNPSMASNARAVLAGFDWYVVTALADGRPTSALNATSRIVLGSGHLDVRLDLVIEDDGAVAGRGIFWDGPMFDPGSAAVSAYAFAAALEALYPDRTFASIGIWQARRQQRFEIAFSDALAQRAAVTALYERLVGGGTSD